MPMKKLLLCICFFSALSVYPSNPIIFSGSDSDTLLLNSEKLPITPKKQISTSFLDKLESKFSKLEEKPIKETSIPDFNWDYINQTYTLPDSTNAQRKDAMASFTEIEQNGNWVDYLGNEDIVDLPVGLKDTIGNVVYSIGVIRAEINPQYTALTVFARVTIPQSNDKGEALELFFGADDVKLSHQGGIIGDAKLVLLGDVPIPFNGG